MKTLILTETQVKNIIDNIIFEQNKTKTESKTVPLNVNWGTGKWKLTTDIIGPLSQKLIEITNFINQHKDSQITIQIESGESRVTNYDREVSDKVRLEPGVLAQRRGESMVGYLKKYFEGLLSKGAIKKMPNLPEPKIKIGDTIYYSGSTSPDNEQHNFYLKNKSNYAKEQFVNAVISLKKDYECIVGLEVTIGYFPGKNKTSHTCDESIFELRLNGISLGEVNLNNSSMDVGLTNLRGRDKKSQEDYERRLTKVTNDWNTLVKSGQVRDNERQKRKYFEDYLGEKPSSLVQTSLPSWLNVKAERNGYGDDVNKFISDLDTINDSFKNYGRYSDGKAGGARSQTFKIDAKLAQSIIDNSPSDRLVFSIVPLVTKDGKYKIYYTQGSHSDTPWVTIKSLKSETPLFDGEPNVNMKRGATSETVLLQTNLCGEPITTI